MNLKKGFFRIWIVITFFWLFLFGFAGFPVDSIKTLKAFGVIEWKYEKQKDAKLIKCILKRELEANSKREKFSSEQKEVLARVINRRAIAYAEKIGLSENYINNAVASKEYCEDIEYNTISELEDKPYTKDIIAEINTRIENALSKITSFALILFGLPIGLLLFGLAIRYIFDGFRKNNI